MRMSTKHAAMFGLDARIALAIFGALSVISGAALYSAIQESRLTALWTKFQEIVKAQEQYFLDNSKRIDIVSSTGFIGDLVENRESLSTWKGPYLNYTRKSNYDLRLEYSGTIFDLSLFQRAGDEDKWNSDVTSYPHSCHSGVDTCILYIQLEGNTVAENETLLQLFNDLDHKYDNGDGAAKGLVRYREYTTGNISLYVEGMLIPKAMTL